MSGLGDALKALQTVLLLREEGACLRKRRRRKAYA